MSSQYTAINDASRMNETVVSGVIRPETIQAMRDVLAKASRSGESVAIAGARHSMGGQSIPANAGISVELPEQPVVIAPDGKSYRTGSGTRWHTVTDALHGAGLSVNVMQSNNDFSVGGTMSVNAHGWPVPFGPFASTVRNFSMMLADGTVVDCSRDKNAELFSLALGGYGAFGVILDAELDAVPNCMMRFSQDTMAADDFAAHFIGGITDKYKDDIRMSFGRLSLSKNNFLKEATAAFFRAVPGDCNAPIVRSKLRDAFARAVYNTQKISDFGKSARWFAESRIVSGLSTTFSRNSALSTPVSIFQTRTQGRTDILHEYFLPPEKFGEFLEGCRSIIPFYKQDLMNVTMRYVDADKDTVMAFAPEPRICAVMLFDQAATPQADAAMQAMTRGLIDHALQLGGSYYLPYRLHATNEQFHCAYPQAEKFFEKKREYDPKNIFGNALLRTYG